MVILDGGSETPVTKNTGHNFTFPSGADKPVSDPPANIGQMKQELIEKEKQFQAEWKKSPGSFTSQLTPDARIQLNRHLPTTNRDSISVWINKLDKSLVWQAVGSGSASSGDLGYTYGVLKVLENPDVLKGHYVRIWKKHTGSGWLVEIEMINID
jgi:hypothetical protein